MLLLDDQYFAWREEIREKEEAKIAAEREEPNESSPSCLFVRQNAESQKKTASTLASAI